MPKRPISSFSETYHDKPDPGEKFQSFVAELFAKDFKGLAAYAKAYPFWRCSCATCTTGIHDAAFPDLALRLLNRKSLTPELARGIKDLLAWIDTWSDEEKMLYCSDLRSALSQAG